MTTIIKMIGQMIPRIIRITAGKSRTALLHRILLASLVLMAGVYGCESLRSTKPVMPIKEYEKMLMGRLDADYVGTDTCLKSCHYHDKLRKDFDASTMGAQMSKETHMPLVNCESCHGPGSLVLHDITEEHAAEYAKAKESGKKTERAHESLIDLAGLPAQAKALLCLKCHSENASFNLHNWNAGAHAVNGVSCFDCHNVHSGPSLITKAPDTRDMCMKCHQTQSAEFMLPSRHPVMEKKMFCTDCHDPHGTSNEGLLAEDTIKATCTRCHGEKEGPFTFEHADANDDCSTCHSPHGSVNNNLLRLREPFLCMQCHQGHSTSASSTRESKGALYTRCTDCHSQIHGTDLPSTLGKGKFIN